MKKFSLTTFAGASLGVLAFVLRAPGSVSAQMFGSSGGSSGGSKHASLFSHGSSGGSSHGSLFAGHGSSGGSKHASLFSHGSSGGSSHGSLFAGHGSSGGSKHASLFSHGSSGGSSHGSLFSGHGSSGGSKHASLFSHGSSGGSKHGSLFSHGSSGGSSHGSMFKGHGSSGGSSHGSMFQGHGSSGGSTGGSAGGYYMSANVVSTDTMLATSTVAAPVLPASTGVAFLNVSVPADAKVYLQDQLMTVGGTERRFVTPQMENGVQHVYTVKVEVVRNGQTITKTTQATVAAGQQVAVSVAVNSQNPQELVATTALLASL